MKHDDESMNHQERCEYAGLLQESDSGSERRGVKAVESDQPFAKWKSYLIHTHAHTMQLIYITLYNQPISVL